MKWTNLIIDGLYNGTDSTLNWLQLNNSWDALYFLFITVKLL